MSSRLSKPERVKRNNRIKRLFFKHSWSLREIQKEYHFKSPKSVYNIVHPEKHNRYQLDRYYKNKSK